MKRFLKFALVVIVSALLSVLLVTFLFVGMLSSFSSSFDKVTVLQPHSVYHIELDGGLVERSSKPGGDMFKKAFGMSSSLGLNEILANIEKAKDDPNVEGIRLDCGAVPADYASLKEIRDALADFKTSGKFVVAYADQYSQDMYYLASVADEVLLNPVGSLSFKGIACEITFYKNMFDKLGVEMQITRVGSFKSAVEPYTLTEMSKDNRLQMMTLANSVWNSLKADIAATRNFTPEQLDEYADAPMDFKKAEEVLECGFVDRLIYKGEVNKLLEERMGVEPRLVKHAAMTSAITKNKKQHKTKVGVIYAVGGIDTGHEEGIVSKDLVETIAEVADDDKIGAVVFRINSGGGSAFGSEQIWYALSQLKEKKPLIVSMGGAAASGGYYIACLADRIVAQPTTLTGSIGVLGMIPNTEKLIDKLGLTFDAVETNKHSDGISLYRPMSTEEYGMMQSYVDRIYELFVKRCAEGRNMTPEAIREIGEGRVWTGADALEIGLVDVLGGLNDAIQLAAQAAELEEYDVVEYPKAKTFFEEMMKEFSGEVKVGILRPILGSHYDDFMMLEAAASKQGGVFAMMPYSINLR